MTADLPNRARKMADELPGYGRYGIASAAHLLSELAGEVERLTAERDRHLAIIHNAPHGLSLNPDARSHAGAICTSAVGGTCDCWKSRVTVNGAALGEEQP